MDLKTVKLHTADYEKFLAGNEVACRFDSPGGPPQPGEEVLVLRDTTANHTVAGAPTRERQADYIGIKAIVKRISNTEADPGISIVKR